MNKYKIAGLNVCAANSAELADVLLVNIENKTKTALFFANTNFIVKCQPIVHLLANEHIVIVNDGVGMDLANLLVNRCRFPDNLNGTDFVPFICRKSKRPLRIFLVGAKPGIANKAAKVLIEQYGQQIVGVCDGYGQFKSRPQLVEEINSADADVVLVAFGNPMQEQWIIDNTQKINAPLMLGIGALFDFLAGDKQRAPVWVRRIRMEWFFRMCLEPRRLLKRYTYDLLIFFYYCIAR